MKVAFLLSVMCLSYSVASAESRQNYPSRNWPRNCSELGKVQQDAIQDAIRRCQSTNPGVKCVVDPRDTDSLSPIIIPESYVAAITGARPGVNVSIDSDANFLTFSDETANWYEQNCRPQNHPKIESPRDCSRYQTIRQSAVQDAVRRCQLGNNGSSCAVDPDTENHISPVVIPEAYVESIRNAPPGTSVSVDSDANFFSFTSETESWYRENCPTALANSLGSALSPTPKTGANINDAQRSSEPKLEGPTPVTPRSPTSRVRSQ